MAVSEGNRGNHLRVINGAGQNCLLYAPQFPSGQKNEMYYDKLANEIALLLDAACGHALVLFTSYAAMSAVKERLSEKDLVWPLFTLGRNAVHTTEQFKASPGKPTVKLSIFCSYEQLTRSHIKPQIGSLYLNTLRVDDLQDFFNERREHGNVKAEGGLSPKTLTNLRNLLHLALDQAVKNKLLKENPIEGVRLPKNVQREMRVLSRDEQDRLIKAARQAPEPAAFGIIFDLFTGLRLGELCGLRWQNVDMEQGIFRVCETRNRLPNHDDSIAVSTSVKTVSSTKTDHSRRTVYLLDELLEDLAYYKEIQDSITAEYSGYNREGYVFCQENGQPYEPRTYQDLFKRCVRQAGIKDANFHALRHTFATRSLEAGMDVVTLSRLLGHANPSITMDKYGHALDDHKRASVGKLGGIYAGAKKTPAAKKRDER